MFRLFSLSFLLLPSLMFAEGSPFPPPCSVCPEFARPPYPHTGHWHDPERPGTGINIDMQSGIMAAMYYGYREDGTSVWLLASGELHLSEADDVYWALEADLYEAADGELPGGQYDAPEMTVAGAIHIEVMQRNLIRFRIDDGPIRQMVPMVFGSHTTAYFTPDSGYRMPNFEEGRELEINQGSNHVPWMIIETNPQGGSRWGYAFTGAFPHHGTASFGDTLGLLRYSFSYYDFFPHSMQSATIRCGRVDDLAAVYTNTMAGMSGEEPICVAWSFVTPFQEEMRRYFMPIGNLGDRRFTAVSEDGWVMEGFRLMYD